MVQTKGKFTQHLTKLSANGQAILHSAATGSGSGQGTLSVSDGRMGGQGWKGNTTVGIWRNFIINYERVSID